MSSRAAFEAMRGEERRRDAEEADAAGRERERNRKRRLMHATRAVASLHRASVARAVARGR